MSEVSFDPEDFSGSSADRPLATAVITTSVLLSVLEKTRHL